LADALGLADLELVATEHWVGEFKLDILCTSGDDQVIIGLDPVTQYRRQV